MTWEPRPLPDPSPDSRRFWNAAAGGTLVQRKCTDCGLVYHYPRGRCPDCLSDADWVAVSGRGEVYAYAVCNRIPEWPETHLPAVLAYVTLDEGPRMLTQLVDCRVEPLEIGDEVQVVFLETREDDIAVPAFTPVD